MINDIIDVIINNKYLKQKNVNPMVANINRIYCIERYKKYVKVPLYNNEDENIGLYINSVKKMY